MNDLIFLLFRVNILEMIYGSHFMVAIHQHSFKLSQFFIGADLLNFCKCNLSFVKFSLNFDILILKARAGFKVSLLSIRTIIQPLY